MKTRRLFSDLFLVLPLGLALLAGTATAAEKAKKKEMPAPSAAEAAAMKAWQAYMTPSEGHKKLDGMAGTWNASVKSWMDPAKPPEETKGKAERHWILGGRYLEERFEGTAMGQPFSGIGITGYDNALKKVVGIWVDNMGTGIMSETGSWDAVGKVLTMSGSMTDPMSGKPVSTKSTITVVDPRTQKFEMWSPGMDGKMMKSMEIVYTRTK